MNRDLTPTELLDLLFSYLPRITSEKDMGLLLEAMADLGKQILVADRCSLWLWDEVTDELWTKVAHGLGGRELRMPADRGFAGFSLRTGQTILVRDAYDDPRFNREPDLQNHYRTRSVLCIPIRNTAGCLIGVYQAVNKMTEPLSGEPYAYFNERDLVHLQMTAAYSAKTIESALLLQEVENTQREAIYMMGELAESRSRETGNHVKRVAEFCAVLGRQLNLSHSDVELIRLASPMHDVGKVSTPDAILKKPGRLTNEEFEIMKRHTTEGYTVLSRSSGRIFQTAAQIAYSHHEKWNGSGYPLGLEGVSIPLFGRITAVADVFDALSNDRCYKMAWPIERVILYFQEEKGKHFDPDIAEILLQYIDEFVRIQLDYRDDSSVFFL